MIIRSILLPTDFSRCAESALPYAAQLARLMKARLVCLHVVETAMPPVGYAAVAEPMPVVDIGGQLEESATRELPKLGEREECAGLDVEEVLVHGDAAGEIVRVARERDIDLIVISSHGLGAHALRLDRRVGRAPRALPRARRQTGRTVTSDLRTVTSDE
jgi:nucleotide-binding universal stress UspA family protein